MLTQNVRFRVYPLSWKLQLRKQSLHKLQPVAALELFDDITWWPSSADGVCQRVWIHYGQDEALKCTLLGLDSYVQNKGAGTRVGLKNRECKSSLTQRLFSGILVNSQSVNPVGGEYWQRKESPAWIYGRGGRHEQTRKWKQKRETTTKGQYSSHAEKIYISSTTADEDHVMEPNGPGGHQLLFSRSKMNLKPQVNCRHVKQITNKTHSKAYCIFQGTDTCMCVSETHHSLFHSLHSTGIFLSC